MAYKVYNGLKQVYPQLEVIVAPYEADAQLAYQSKIGYVDAIITEDSDLIPFGGNCMIYKLDNNFECKEIKSENVKKSKEIDFASFDETEFLYICIQSGCDYLSSPKGVAFKTAHTYFKKYGTLNKVLEFIKTNKAKSIDDDYVKNFYKAYLTFRYQRVWCPLKQEIVYLNEIPGEIDQQEGDSFKDTLIASIENLKAFNKDLVKLNDLELLKFFRNEDPDLSFLGPHIEKDKAKSIADCQTDPTTKLLFNDEEMLHNEAIPREKLLELAFNKGSAGGKDEGPKNGTIGNYFPINNLSKNENDIKPAPGVSKFLDDDEMIAEDGFMVNPNIANNVSKHDGDLQTKNGNNGQNNDSSKIIPVKNLFKFNYQRKPKNKDTKDGGNNAPVQAQAPTTNTIINQMKDDKPQEFQSKDKFSNPATKVIDNKMDEEVVTKPVNPFLPKNNGKSHQTKFEKKKSVELVSTQEDGSFPFENFKYDQNQNGKKTKGASGGDGGNEEKKGRLSFGVSEGMRTLMDNFQRKMKKDMLKPALDNFRKGLMDRKSPGSHSD